MLYKKLILIALLGLATLSAYMLHAFLKKKLNPYASAKQGFLFLVFNLIGIVVLVFVFAFIIFYFKEFFFKK